MASDPQVLAGAPVLAVHAGKVRFGAFDALGPVSLSVRAGQCVVLLGPSGCGKSTLLSAVAGLLPLAEGTMDARGGPPGFVFQDPTLLPWCNITDNVALPLALAKAPKDEQKRKALAALELVGLGAFAAARPRELSGGMAMRAALARALVTQPDVLLLDEPFGAIDELGRRHLNDLVLDVKNTRQVAMLFVTHSVEEAVYMADTVLVLSHRPGQIVARIDVAAPQGTARHDGFLLSPEFGRKVVEVRKALAAGVVEAAA
ncbi:MAG: hypothetical protein RLZZ157_448 [Pseudomonadota bacterium]|jgi:NitT/TauT family transport system ATP-binding protein